MPVQWNVQYYFTSVFSALRRLILTTFNIQCLVCTGENFVLISWPEENDDVSVISRQRIKGPLVVGELCKVTEKRTVYPARVHATGMHTLYVPACTCTQYAYMNVKLIAF